MQAYMTDAVFYYRKKNTIKLSDLGIVDIVLGSEGLTANGHLVSGDKDRTSAFKVKKVHVKVNTLKFIIRDTKH